MKKTVSFILPCLNEEKGIGICIDKIKKVIRELNLEAEIIVVDNGCTDKSIFIAKTKGAKVVYEPKRGYGAACLKGFSEAKGDFILMGDADDSYNFLETPKFIMALEEGYDFIIGSRIKGKTLAGSMPFLNKIGNKILSGMVRIFFRTDLSDIHCGLRGLTKEAFSKMRLKCGGMEFASEMVFSALKENLKIKEIPITYYPRKGKSKLLKFQDAWRHIKFILLYSPSYLYFLPGSILFIIGIIFLLLLVKGPAEILFRIWDLHLMVLSAFFSIVGFQIINFGLLVKAYGKKENIFIEDKIFEFFYEKITLERGLLTGFIIFLMGLSIDIWVLAEWISKNFGELSMTREALFGITLTILGIQIIFFSFFFALLKEK